MAPRETPSVSMWPPGRGIAGPRSRSPMRLDSSPTTYEPADTLSRKAPLVSERCELCHSLASESAARQLSIPALVEVNLAGEETKSGIAPEQLEDFLGFCAEVGVNVRGLMTMPPLTSDPEASRPYFRRLRELAERFDLPQLSMGTSQDYLVAAEEGATFVRVGSVLWS